MARAINKSIKSATVTVVVFEDNQLVTKQFSMNGNPSENKALITAQKKFGNNVMVQSIDVDETKITVDNDTFYANSDICIDGVEYGREYVTQTFKLTYYHFLTMENGNMVDNENCYHGVTTDNKLRKHAIDASGTKNVIVTNKVIKEERRYMTRERYMQLAR